MPENLGPEPNWLSLKWLRSHQVDRCKRNRLFMWILDRAARDHQAQKQATPDEPCPTTERSL